MHVSYNSLPAWGSALGMARLLRTVGRQRAARSDRQAEEGFKFIREMLAAEAVQLKRSEIVKVLMEKLDELPSIYLAHEYMNDAWAPCFMADVAEAIGGCQAGMGRRREPDREFPRADVDRGAAGAGATGSTIRWCGS